MSQYAKLLLIAEGPPEATPAFRRAAHLARATRAELHVVLFCGDPLVDGLAGLDPTFYRTVRDACVQQQREALHRLTEPLAREGLTVHTELAWEPPFADTMLARILALQPDLAIKDVRHEPLLRRVLLQPVDWQLVNWCPAPLLLVNRRARQVPSRVIAAVDTRLQDGDDTNDAIVHAGLALALQCDAEACLVHVTDFAYGAAFAALPGEAGMPVAFAELARLEEERFAGLAARHAVPADRRHRLQGPVHRALAEFARDAEGDVLVIGAAYRTGVERVFLGRTATAILEQAACDVLVVKPRGFRDALLRDPPRQLRAA